MVIHRFNSTSTGGCRTRSLSFNRRLRRIRFLVHVNIMIERHFFVSCNASCRSNNKSCSFLFLINLQLAIGSVKILILSDESSFRICSVPVFVRRTIEEKDEMFVRPILDPNFSKFGSYKIASVCQSVSLSVSNAFSQNWFIIFF